MYANTSQPNLVLSAIIIYFIHMSCKLSFHAVDLIKDLSSYDYTHKLELCLKMYIVVRG